MEFAPCSTLGLACSQCHASCCGKRRRHRLHGAVGQFDLVLGPFYTHLPSRFDYCLYKTVNKFCLFIIFFVLFKAKSQFRNVCEKMTGENRIGLLTLPFLLRLNRLAYQLLYNFEWIELLLLYPAPYCARKLFNDTFFSVKRNMPDKKPHLTCR